MRENLHEIRKQQQGDAAIRIIQKLRIPEETSGMDYVVSVPIILATLYAENPPDEFIFMLDSIRDDAIMNHAQTRQLKRMREAGTQ